MLRTNLKSLGFIRLSSSLTPMLDFGKQPVTPIEHIIELVKLVSEKGKAKSDH